MTLQARFGTHERAMQVYRLLESHAHVELPERDAEGPYPWTLAITFAPGQQALVIGTVGRYGGVTFDEDG